MDTASLRRPAAVMALALAGCATQQQTASLQCGVGGAAAAFIACKLLGNSDKACAGVAAVGGGIGAGVCYSYADKLEKRRQELAGRENDLDARLKYVRGLNEDARQLNIELQARVDSASKRATASSAQAARAKPPAEQVAKERKALDDEIQAANQQVQLQGKALTEVKSFQAKKSSPDLDREIAKQDRLLADAQRHVAAMVSMRESLPA